MKFRSTGILLTLCAVVFLSGCVMSERYQGYRHEVDQRSFLQNYADTWKDWYSDLTDIVKLEGSLGHGLGLYVQPTKIAAAGGQFTDVMKVGFGRRAFGFYREVRAEGGATWFYYRDMEFEPIWCTEALFQRERLYQGFPIRDTKHGHWTEIGFETHLLFIGGSFYFSPKETIDFIGSTVLLPYNMLWRGTFARFGWVTPEVDLSNDDSTAELRKKYGVDLVRQPEHFLPAEFLDDLMRLGY